MTETLTKIFQSSFFKNSTHLLSANIIAQIINFLSSILLARIFGPTEFGILAIYASIIGVGIIFCTLKIELSIVQLPDFESVQSLLGSLSIQVFIVAFFATLLSIFIYPEIDMLLAVVIYIGLVANSFYWISHYLRTYQENFKSLSYSKLVQVCLNISIAIALGMTIKHESSLAIANVISFTVAYIFIVRGDISYFTPTSKNYIADLKKNISFVKTLFPTNLLDTFTQFLPVFFLAKFFSKELTGHFGMAMKVGMLPIGMIGLSFGQVFYRKILDYKRTQDRLSFILKNWLMLFTVSLVMFVTLFFFSEPLFVFLFGPQWIEAAKIIKWLSPLLSTFLIFSSTSTLFIVIDRKDLPLKLAIFNLLTRGAALAYGSYVSDIFIAIKIWVAFDCVAITIMNLLGIRELKKCAE